MDLQAITNEVRRAGARSDYQSIVQLTRQALAQGSVSTELLDWYARACSTLGHQEEAIRAVEKAIEAGSATLSRVLLLGDLLLRTQQWRRGSDVFQQVIKEDENNNTAWLGLGHCLLGAGDSARAARCYGRVLELDAEHEDAQFRLAICKLNLGDAPTALELLKPIHEKHPASPEVKLYLGEALISDDDFRGGLELLKSVADHSGFGRRAVRGVAHALTLLGFVEEAQAWLDRVMVDSSGDDDLVALQARIYAVQGRNEEALGVLRTLVEARHSHPGPWEMYLDLTRQPLSVGEYEAVMAMRDDAAAREDRYQEGSFDFVLARHYNAAGDYDGEMAALRRANAAIARITSYSGEQHNTQVRTMREVFDRSRIEELQSASPYPAFQPVFILCPPRSGSTLLEQALGRHEECQPLGEVDFFKQAWTELKGDKPLLADPEAFRELSNVELARFAEYYMEAARSNEVDPDKRMIHKGINNHKIAGLLKAAFPAALFIELDRHPLDVAFGCFKQNFQTQPFSFSPEGCASEIGLFQDNMKWWKDQFGEAIYVQSYEDLVADFEGELRRLLHWLGLEWDPGCIDYSRAGSVSTASMTQVREKVFSHGVGRWRRYADHLGDFREAMSAQGVTIPDENEQERSA